MTGKQPASRRSAGGAQEGAVDCSWFLNGPERILSDAGLWREHVSPRSWKLPGGPTGALGISILSLPRSPHKAASSGAVTRGGQSGVFVDRTRTLSRPLFGFKMVALLLHTDLT